jgi:hypothetical protein
MSSTDSSTAEPLAEYWTPNYITNDSIYFRFIEIVKSFCNKLC